MSTEVSKRDAIFTAFSYFCRCRYIRSTSLGVFDRERYAYVSRMHSNIFTRCCLLSLLFPYYGPIAQRELYK